MIPRRWLVSIPLALLVSATFAAHVPAATDPAAIVAAKKALNTAVTTGKAPDVAVGARHVRIAVGGRSQVGPAPHMGRDRGLACRPAAHEHGQAAGRDVLQGRARARRPGAQARFQERRGAGDQGEPQWPVADVQPGRDDDDRPRDRSGAVARAVARAEESARAAAQGDQHAQQAGIRRRRRVAGPQGVREGAGAVRGRDRHRSDRARLGTRRCVPCGPAAPR